MIFPQAFVFKQGIFQVFEGIAGSVDDSGYRGINYVTAGFQFIPNIRKLIVPRKIAYVPINRGKQQ
jgi:hypothetical protein